MTCKPKVSAWGQFNNFKHTLVIDRYFRLQNGLLWSFYTGSSTCPTAWSMCGTPVSWCCPAPHVIELQSLHGTVRCVMIEACFVSIIDATFTKCWKQVGHFSTYSISIVVLAVCFLEFNVMRRFPSRQPTICWLKSLWLSFLAYSPDLLFGIGWVTCSPDPGTVQNHWLRAFSMSGTLCSCFCFQDVRCCPSCNTHSLHSFSCSSITWWLYILVLQLLLLAGDEWC